MQTVSPFNNCKLVIFCLALFPDFFGGHLLASTYDSVYSTPYQNEKEQKQSVSDLNTIEKPALVLLWANWCEPCKKELRYAVESLKHSEKILVVTVNVDDSSDQDAARAYLRSIRSPFPSLFDSDGSHFYSYHQSGQLPLVLFFGKSGSLNHKMSAFHAKERDFILRSVEDNSEQLSRPKDRIVVTNQFRFREQKQKNAPTKKVVAERFNSTFTDENFELSVNYDQLHQSVPNGSKLGRYEDEIGYSYLSYRHAASFGQMTLRAGGKNHLVNNGYSLSARTNRELNENLYLSGAYVLVHNDDFSLDAFYGKLKNNLYPAIIDPTTDLSKTLAEVDVYGSVVKFAKIELGAFDLKPEVNFTALKRKKEPLLGYTESYSDQRIGFQTGFDTDLASIKYIHTRYEAENEAKANAQFVSLTAAPIEAGAWSLIPSASFQRVDIERDDLYEYVTLPVLTDELTTPLLKRKRRDHNLKFRLENSALHGLFLEPIYAEQYNLEPDSAIRLYNSGAKLGLSALKLKLQWSRSIRTDQLLTQRSKESILSGSFPIFEELTGFFDLRDYQLNHLNKGLKLSEGRRQTLGLNFSHAFQNDHSFSADVFHYRTSGYYFSQSGLNIDSFWSERLQYSHQWLTLAAVFGQEPGGYMCTAGNCQYLEPRNGTEFSSGIHFSF